MIMSNPTLEGKIYIFQTKALSKIPFQSFITTVQKHFIDELEKVKNTFVWKNS